MVKWRQAEAVQLSRPRVGTDQIDLHWVRPPVCPSYHVESSNQQCTWRDDSLPGLTWCSSPEGAGFVSRSLPRLFTSFSLPFQFTCKWLLNFQLLYFSLHPYEQGRPFFRWLCLSKPTYNTVFLVGRTQWHVMLRPSPWNGQQFTALNSSHPTTVLSYPVAVLVMTFSWFLMNVPYCSTQIVSFWEVPAVSWSFLNYPNTFSLMSPA